MRKMQDELLSVQWGQEEAAERSERNAWKENYQFKRKGNELQYKFNDRMADKVVAADAAIAKVEITSTSSKALLDCAAKELEEGTALISHRQKVIKLADRSEASWVVMEEYEVDGLADDSEDEQRMEKAEGKAEKNLAKKQKLKEAKAKGKFGAKPPVAYGMPQLFPAKSMEATKGAGAQPKPAPRFSSGTCFECGDAGHWRR